MVAFSTASQSLISVDVSLSPSRITAAIVLVSLCLESQTRIWECAKI
jgi:hypothetical protein